MAKTVTKILKILRARAYRTEYTYVGMNKLRFSTNTETIEAGDTVIMER